MTDTIIVTLRSGASAWDFRLPSRMPLRLLYPQLLLALRQTDEATFGETSFVVLACGKRCLLDGQATLEAYGIASGALLSILKGEEYPR